MKNSPLTPRSSPLGLLSRVLLGLAFVAAGAFKASSPAEEFEVVIRAYQVLPDGMTLTLATFLPWIEIVIGYALIFGYFTRPASAAGGGLLACFILALASARLRGIPLPNCGCFGAGFHASTAMAMGMDAVLVALAIASFKSGGGGPGLDLWASRSGS